MGTPLGDFVRAKRDSIQPESFGLSDRGRRRSPGLRRSDLATRAGISVEYLTRIEQGRDRNPSPAVLNALADALSLDAGERHHLRYLAKITGGTCAGRRRPAPPDREVRPTVRETLRLLEPGAAYVTNRLGDVLAYTDGFELVMGEIGLLGTGTPNLTRYVFTDPRARTVFPDWDQVADEQVFDLWLGPSAETAEWFRADLAPVAGQEFTRRLHHHLPPPPVPLRLAHPAGHELRWHREKLELRSTDAQQLVVLLPADEATAAAVERLRRRSRGLLRSVS
ncbi:transcriptional regulator [Micromonospora globispora]|uniref:Transcriptional regulator n=1 Tax=Micromonospora globispora TaxID=1450148 RepID=A0A317K8J9_9ACTN|nr:helix-turn-helix transcriptional regulator [Micromonospora globispora]PWU49541.1 transcriptional regulator [Micromonospora globispora]PWU60918.1 transcriptional regulator [Micromonospora globispora]RQW99092.1 transcriptional regulator [Micromonospora globispora]